MAKCYSRIGDYCNHLMRQGGHHLFTSRALFYSVVFSKLEQWKKGVDQKRINWKVVGANFSNLLQKIIATNTLPSGDDDIIGSGSILNEEVDLSQKEFQSMLGTFSQEPQK